MPEYVFNGNYRRTTMTVVKKDSQNVPISTDIYSILDSFSVGVSEYTQITEEQLQTMSVALYNQRLSDFYSYVEGEHEGLLLPEDVNPSAGPYGTNATTCPVGTIWGQNQG